MEWSLARRIVPLPAGEPADEVHGSPLPPVLVEGDDVVLGAQAIHAYIDALEPGLRLDRSISGDACYLDPNDPTQCL